LEGEFNTEDREENWNQGQKKQHPNTSCNTNTNNQPKAYPRVNT